MVHYYGRPTVSLHTALEMGKIEIPAKQRSYFLALHIDVGEDIDWHTTLLLTIRL